MWTNTATATADDGTTANDTCSVTVHEEDHESPSFTVTKTVDKPEVEAGDVVTYTLSVYNDGHLSNINNLEINDVMPGIPVANFIDFKLDPSSTVTQTPGNVTINPSQRSAEIVSLEVGEEAKFTYRVKIPDDSPIGKVWTNIGTAKIPGKVKSDVCNVKVKAPTDKVVIGKTADKNKAKKNETVKYTITVKNISSEILNNVKVSDSLNVTLVQKTFNNTVVISGNTATIGTLNPNETVIFEYDYTVPASAVIGSNIENTAKAIDPKNKEYIAKKEVEVVGTPKLAVKKTVDKPIARAARSASRS